MGAEKCSKGEAWFCTTGLPSDVLVLVDDMTFHLHKFPLMSKSKKLHDLISLQEESILIPQPDHDDDNDNDDEDDHVLEQPQCLVSLSSFPGSSQAFEIAAKFCYGVKIDLTPAKVVPLRCAGEILEMTEDYSEDNLIFKTERFFSQSVLKNIRDSIKALKSCEKLCPLAENLGIVQRCIHAISSKASLYDPTLFGWPVNESVPGAGKKALNPAKQRDAWLEDLAQLNSDLFNRVISAMREEQVNAEIIETCLINYAKRCFPGIIRSNRKPSSSSSSTVASEAEQRELLELIVSNLVPEKISGQSPTSTRYLFGLLRTANILSASEACKSTLEKKIGTQLEQATLDDLLIPSYSYLNETLYDIDCVQRILAHFLDCYKERETDGDNGDDDDVRSTAIMLVGKLIDGYLSEIASDANLKPEKFCELSISLPEQARLYDDGVYRAVDVYLKAHPWIGEEERERVSGTMDCQKLTLEACTHAAQNERLPLRAVVQVLFFEQLQLREAIAGTLLSGDNITVNSPEGGEDEDEREREENRGTWNVASRENQVLRLDMDSMRSRVHELERECITMKRVIEKIGGGPQDEKNWKNSFTRKFGCKFKTQVCDSHESTVVEARKGRHRSNQR